MASILVAKLGASMNDPEIQDAAKKLCDYHEEAVTLTQRMRPLTKEQEWKIAALLTRQKREYDDLLKHFIETGPREELVQEARKAAQRAVYEPGLERQTDLKAPTDGWRNMWIALVIIGAILVFLRLRF
jgi:anti-sigma-K factor RskA